MNTKVSKNEMNMTAGNLFVKILKFSVPLIFSGILQLLYTATDLIVCGIFGSEHSVGAISSTNALINLIVNLFLGLSVGANVLMARCFGSGQKEKGQRVVYTAMILAVIIGLAVGAFGAIFSGYFLVWMGTTEDVISLSTTYLVIYFCGLPFSLVYNFGASLLRAVGDTKRPFYFLSSAGVFNVLFNLLFVIVFKMDVAGVALGTILAQAISAVCIVVCLLKNKGFFEFSLKKMRFYKQEALEMAKIGLPAGLQSAIFSLSNVLIQSGVNSLGTATVDGNGAASSLEGFIYVTMNSVAQACIAFVSANYGAKQWKNIKKVAGYSCIYVCIFGAAMGVIEIVLGRLLLKLYLSSPEPIEIGYKRLVLVCATYYLCGLMEVFAYSLRGIGHSTLPAVVSLVGACGSRVIWIYTVFPLEAFHSLDGIMMSYPISWLLTAAVQLTLFVVMYKKIPKDEPSQTNGLVEAEGL